MENIKVLISEETLNSRIKEVAKEIENDYKGEEIVLICILKGASYFAIDLSKHIDSYDVILDFMKVHSYGKANKETTGKVNIDLVPSEDLKGKNVIIIEDILDSGVTLNCLYDYIKDMNPKTLKICVLLDKKGRRIKDIEADYVGFEIDNKFIVGYGMDYDEKCRNLPFIGYVE